MIERVYIHGTDVKTNSGGGSKVAIEKEPE
jgi:hypothetical protein